MKSVHIDGALVFSVAFFGGLLTAFSADSVYQYVNPHCVFYVKAFAGSMSMGCTALIGFRSKVFARYSDSLPQPQPTPETATVAQNATVQTQPKV